MYSEWICRRAIIAIFFSLVLIALPVCADDAKWWFGRGDYTGYGDWDAVEDRATAAALEKALARRILQSVDRATLKRKARTIEQQIFPRMDELVLEYNVTYRRRVGNRWTVEVKARLEDALLENLLVTHGLLQPWEAGRELLLVWLDDRGEQGYAARDFSASLTGPISRLFARSGLRTRTPGKAMYTQWRTQVRPTSIKAHWDAVTAVEEGARLVHVYFVVKETPVPLELARFASRGWVIQPWVVADGAVQAFDQAYQHYALTVTGQRAGLNPDPWQEIDYYPLLNSIAEAMADKVSRYHWQAEVYAHAATTAFWEARRIADASSVDNLLPIRVVEKDGYADLRLRFYSAASSEMVFEQVQHLYPDAVFTPGKRRSFMLDLRHGQVENGAR